MPIADLIFDDRDLLLAASDSCGGPLTFFRNFIERTPVPVKRGLLPRVLLPALDNTVRILGIDFHEPRLTPAALTRDQGTSGTPKQVRGDIPRLAAVDQSPFDELDRLHGRVETVRRRFLLFP